MYAYANGFQISIKNDQSEVHILFTQSFPVFNRGENPTETQEEVVSSVILSGGMAKELLKNMGELLSSTPE